MSERRKAPTSVDIARAAGISQATVSRALNGGVVSDETRARILQISKSLGYSPNAVARGLVTSRTGLVGVVVSDITNPFYPEFLEEIGRTLADRGQQMLLQNGHAGDQQEAVELLLQQRVDGIILTAATPGLGILRDLVRRRFPLVLANRTVDLACDSVEGDNAAGAAAVVDHLYGLGHRRFAMIEGTAGTSTATQRTAGFLGRLADHGIELKDEFRVRTDFRYEQAFTGTERLLDRRYPPSAIFCHNDLLAFAALNVIKERGLRVPEDVSVVGFDNTLQSGWKSIDLTTVDQPLAAMAARSVELLGGRLAEPELPPRREVFPAELIIRGSTGRRRPRSRS
ncbi:LacI family DNA-binding transcriptional regulator [Microlunatus parietis]|uniref:LacI family transcriptional regulator n=1 Tax=Microlunatus parietis TaxID=682979 RepID=A0A7Y9I1W4_9ACTN|nr:LacI family DNA-binding transcriptional regulator [Microlunatus parietis]NYE68718.1 LacI family transcriptional regulator [Microlunatus parietis]